MVTQIGGLFLKSNDAKSLADWYADRLGLKYEFMMGDNLFGLSLFYVGEKDKKRYTVFSISQSKDELDLLAPKAFTLNLRVLDMEAALNQLKAKNESYRGPEKHDQGLFAWVTDPDGNEVELWQDVD